MATGDQSDILGRLKTVLPPGWFASAGSSSGTATSPTPILDAILSGVASVGAWAYGLLQYAKQQTRLSTATDEWLDIGIYDLVGPALPRFPGESDLAYWQRAQPQLLPKANTRPNLQAALQALTGGAVRMIEPWDPRDTFVWDRSFWDVDTAPHPGNWTNPGDRALGFVKSGLPVAAGAQAPPASVCRDGSGFWDATLFWWDAAPVGGGGAFEVFALINRLKVFGVTAWVQFPGVIGNVLLINPLTDDSGDVLADDSGDVLINA